jgi:tRNA A-37 threonylcarbamoyl transferase component Bud32
LGRRTVANEKSESPPVAIHPARSNTTTGCNSEGELSGPDRLTSIGDGAQELIANRPGVEHSASASLQYRDRQRYKYLSEHGRGGLGRVFRARDRELDRDVALKELLQRNSSAEARFVREYMVTARLEHPSIVPVHEAGRWRDGTPFYAMKLVAGRPLSALLAKTKTFAERLVLLPHLIAVADATAYAHSCRIIHRDLKPSNVIVGDFGETALIDWGVAKDLADEENESAQGPYRGWTRSDLTVDGTVLGTPAYMSPEQARGAKVDTRTDVYSLGAMLFQLCAGAPPPPDSALPDLRRALRGVPEDLATIALKSLAQSPEDRYPDASVFVADLRAYDAGARIAARKYSLAAVLGHWVRQHKRIAVAVAIPTLIAIVIGVLSLQEIILRGDREAAAKQEAEAARRLAEKEQAVAEQERRAAERDRDRAVRSEVALLLEKDPTRARDLLASRKVLSPEEALLMARAQGAGFGEHTISLLPYKIFRAVPDRKLQTLAVVASDNRLRKIDLSTGAIEIIDDHLLEPPLVIRDGTEFVYARRGSAGPELVRTSGPMRPVPIGRFRQSSDNYGVATADGVYLLDARGELFLLSPVGGLRPFFNGIRGIAEYGTGVLACTEKDLLHIGPGQKVARIGACYHDGGRYAFAANNANYVMQSSPSTIVLSRQGIRHTLRTRDSNALVVAGGGLVAGVNQEDETWYLRPGAIEVSSGPRSSAAPTTLAADGNLAAWGFADGVARARDTRTESTWTFVGHQSSIAWVFVSEHLNRLVTVGGPEVRVWHIPPFAVDRLERSHATRSQSPRRQMEGGQPSTALMARSASSSAIRQGLACKRCIDMMA